MALILRQAVVGFLKDRTEQKFTARQIAEWLFETFPEACQERQVNSIRFADDGQLPPDNNLIEVLLPHRWTAAGSAAR